MFQKGSGEGYRAAKADVLAKDPAAVCKAVYGGPHRSLRPVGYMVQLSNGKRGHGNIARDAWNDALDKVDS